MNYVLYAVPFFFLLIGLELLADRWRGMRTYRLADARLLRPAARLRVMGPLFSALTATNEVLGALVVLAVIALWWRRNVKKVRRFSGVEMRAWPRLDADMILYIEIVLMTALSTVGVFIYNQCTDLVGGIQVTLADPD